MKLAFNAGRSRAGRISSCASFFSSPLSRNPHRSCLRAGRRSSIVYTQDGHGRRGQSARGADRRRHPGRRRHRGRRRDRRADGAEPRRAAILGHRRRRVHADVQRRRAARVEIYDGRETAPLTATGNLFIGAQRPAAGIRRRRDRRPLGRHARVCCACSSSRIGTRAGCRGRRCSSPRSGSPRTASRSRRACSRRLPARTRRCATDPVTGPYFYNADGTPEGGRHDHPQPRVRGDAARDRRRRRRRVLHRPDRAGHRQQGQEPSDQPGPARARAISPPTREEARAGLRHLPAMRDLRHQHAVVRRRRRC